MMMMRMILNQMMMLRIVIKLMGDGDAFDFEDSKQKYSSVIQYIVSDKTHCK